MSVPIEKLPIGGGVFDDIKEDPKEFKKFVATSFRSHAKWAGVEPDFGKTEGLFAACHHCYRDGIENLKGGGQSGKPDCFDFCGCLAYWLNRNSPVIDWKETKQDFDLTESEEVGRKLFFSFGRQYQAFCLGYAICLTLESKKEKSSAGKALPEISDDYIRTVCYFMKHENISSHSIGLIYRALFI